MPLCCPMVALLSCVFSPSIWFVCVSEHCIRNLNASWIFIVSVWLAHKAMLSSSIGVGDGPESLYSTLRTVTFIWNSFGRGSDHITLYTSFRNLTVSQVTCGNVKNTSRAYTLVPIVRSCRRSQMGLLILIVPLCDYSRSAVTPHSPWQQLLFTTQWPPRPLAWAMCCNSL